MRYNFEWDPEKAKRNIRKHKVTFERATTIFRDPNAISIIRLELYQQEKQQNQKPNNIDGEYYEK